MPEMPTRDIDLDQELKPALPIIGITLGSAAVGVVLEIVAERLSIKISGADLLAPGAAAGASLMYVLLEGKIRKVIENHGERIALACLTNLFTRPETASKLAEAADQGADEFRSTFHTLVEESLKGQNK